MPAPDGLFAAGRQSVIDIAAQLEVAPLIDGTAVKKKLLARAANSRLLHLHTHCNWNASDPLEHSLDFSSAGEAAQDSNLLNFMEVPEDQQSQRTLTAREVFSLHLQQGAHVNLIA